MRSGLAWACVALILVAGCGPQPQSSAQPGSTSPAPLTGTPDPTDGRPEITPAPPKPSRTLPSGLPTEPTDNLPTDLVVGVVTDGTGPCYGVRTDDDEQYALYGGQGAEFKRGDLVRVKIKPLRLAIYCGPGQHAAIVSITKV